MTKKTITIIIPCVNEEKVIGGVIEDCWIGLKNDHRHQVLIIDSGTDHSGEIAKKLGADVVKTPKRGLGQAYIDSIPHIRGDYVFMGDADGTYDFKEIEPFVRKLDKGYEFVMGTRMRGWIEKGAMPPLHQYFGTPLTTWILDRLFHLRFSDIHCGLRAMTKEALIRIDIRSKSWEYASEMVIKAGLLRLRTSEVPIRFYKDRNGRVSLHKRMGWFSPWYAGWINLKVMFLYAPNFIFFFPGIVLLLLGLLTTFVSIWGTIENMRYHFVILGLTLINIGYLSVQLGIMSKSFSNLQKYYFRDKTTRFIEKKFTYDKGMFLGFILILLGIILGVYFLSQWWASGFMLHSLSIYGISGLIFVSLGFQTIFFAFIYELLRISKK
jgi:glycosyltransferase involved in cell wall biosynthesis